MSRHNLRVRRTHHVDSRAPLFELFDPVIDLVCLFKDKLIYKPGGAAGYPLHQDFIAWPRFPESFTTLFFHQRVALGDPSPARRTRSAPKVTPAQTLD